MCGSIALRWRSPVGDNEVVALGRARPGWWDRVWPHSLGWVVAREGDRLVGFLNVAWDGSDHAFLLDPVVMPEYRRRGLATRLVQLAVGHARQAGCAWMHVDFGEHLRDFYLGACGFRPTAAGLIDLVGDRER